MEGCGVSTLVHREVVPVGNLVQGVVLEDTEVDGLILIEKSTHGMFSSGGSDEMQGPVVEVQMQGPVVEGL